MPDSQTIRETRVLGLAQVAALGAMGGAVAAVADAGHVILTSRLGTGVISQIALVSSGLVVGAVVGGLVGAMIGLPQAARRSSHMTFTCGFAAVVAIALVIGGDALSLAGAVVVVVVAGVLAVVAGRSAWGPRLLPIGLVGLAAAYAGWGRVIAPTARPSSLEHPNVLLVTVGGARVDRFGRHPIDTPAYDRVAAEGVEFALAVTPSTDPAAAALAMLTGRPPWEANPNPDQAMATLAAGLYTRGYASGAFVGTADLARDGVLDQGFQVYDDEQGWFKGFSHSLTGRLMLLLRPDLRASERRADEVVDRAKRWLSGRSGRWFCWVHLDDPTAPYTPPQPWDERYYGGSDPRDPSTATMPPGAAISAAHGGLLRGITDAAYVEARYDGDVAFTDGEIARLIEQVESSGWAPSTLVVIAGLYGQSLRDGSVWFGREGELVDGLIHVPLAIRLPGRVPAGERVRTPAELTDLGPTILDLLGEADALPQAIGLSQRATWEGTGVGRRYSRSMSPGTVREVAVRLPGALLLHDPVQGQKVWRFPSEARLDVWTAERLVDVIGWASEIDGTGRLAADALDEAGMTLLAELQPVSAVAPQPVSAVAPPVPTPPPLSAPIGAPGGEIQPVQPVGPEQPQPAGISP